MDKLISIIVPIYKVEDYLHACVDSILNQTYRNLEIILVNDGSPDHCPEICNNYAKIDSRVIVIHKDNGGLSDARNEGLKISTGDFISFVDSDDILDTKFIELLLKNIGDSDMIVCSYESFDGIVKFQNKTQFDDLDQFTGDQLLSMIGSYKYPLLVLSWNKLYRKEIWNNLKYPKGKIHEDEFIIHHLLNKCQTVKILHSVLYYYRQRNNSIMSDSLSPKAVTDKLEALNDRKKFFLTKGMSHEALLMNNYILYRCVTPLIDHSNKYWEAVDINMIWNESTIKLSYKLLLTLKKKSYSFYILIMKVKNLIKT